MRMSAPMSRSRRRVAPEALDALPSDSGKATQHDEAKEISLPPITSASIFSPCSLGAKSTSREQVVLPLLTAREPLQFRDGVSKDLYDESFLGGFFNDKVNDTAKTSGASGSCTLKSLAMRSRAQPSPRGRHRSPQQSQPATSSTTPVGSLSPRRNYREYFDKLHKAQALQPAVSRSRSQLSQRASGQSRSPKGQDHEPADNEQDVDASEPASPKALSREVSTCKAGLEGRRESQANAEMQRSEKNELRGACESMRLLAFGVIGNEDWDPKEKHLITEQRRGTPAQVKSLIDLWVQLDKDDSDDIALSEFLEFFAERKIDHLLSRRCVRYLAGQGAFHSGDEELEKGPKVKCVGKCCKEDLMRLIWPRATEMDLEAMMEIFAFHKLEAMAVQPLSVLPARRRQELTDNFHHLDRDDSGSLTYDDLAKEGLVDVKMAHELRQQYDLDGNGCLDIFEFLEMLCPYGYRAHENVKVAVDKRGQGMSFIQCRCGQLSFAGWVYDKDRTKFQRRYSVKLVM